MLDDVAGIEAAAKELRAAIPELKSAGQTWITDAGEVVGTTVTQIETALNRVVKNFFERLDDWTKQFKLPVRITIDKP